MKFQWLTKERLFFAAVVLLVLVGFPVRLYDLTDPPLDFHSPRQMRAAIIARGMYYYIQPEANKNQRNFAINATYKMPAYEPPIFEGLVALTYRLIGAETLWVARVYSTIFWVVGGVGVFALGRRFASPWAALIGTAFYLLLPFAVIATRSFQPDPWMVMWLVWALYALFRWQENASWLWAVLAGVFGGLSILIKAMTVFPIGIVSVFVVLAGRWPLWRTMIKPKKWTKTLGVAILQVVCMALLMWLPIIVYYFGLGNRATQFFSFWTVSLGHLIFSWGFYRNWVAFVGSLVGWWALIAAGVGILVASRSMRPILWGAWIGYGIYGLFLPYQMQSHNYYHLMVLPFIALSLTSFIDWGLKRTSGWHWGWRVPAAVFVLWLMGGAVIQSFQVLDNKDFRSEPERWEEIGAALPRDGKAIGLVEDYGHRLIYFGWRNLSTTWPSLGDQYLSAERGNPEEEFLQYFTKRTKEVRYFLITRLDQFESQPELKAHLYQNFALIAQGDDYLIFDLETPAEGP